MIGGHAKVYLLKQSARKLMKAAYAGDFSKLQIAHLLTVHILAAVAEHEASMNAASLLRGVGSGQRCSYAES